MKQKTSGEERVREESEKHGRIAGGIQIQRLPCLYATKAGCVTGACCPSGCQPFCTNIPQQIACVGGYWLPLPLKGIPHAVIRTTCWGMRRDEADNRHCGLFTKGLNVHPESSNSVTLLDVIFEATNCRCEGTGVSSAQAPAWYLPSERRDLACVLHLVQGMDVAQRWLVQDRPRERAMPTMAFSKRG